MAEEQDDQTRLLAYAAIKYSAALLALMITLYFTARHVFPFIQSLF